MEKLKETPHLKPPNRTALDTQIFWMVISSDNVRLKPSGTRLWMSCVRFPPVSSRYDSAVSVAPYTCETPLAGKRHHSQWPRDPPTLSR